KADATAELKQVFHVRADRFAHTDECSSAIPISGALNLSPSRVFRPPLCPIQQKLENLGTSVAERLTVLPPPPYIRATFKVAPAPPATSPCRGGVAQSVRAEES